MARVIWAEPPLDDLRTIADYIARDSPAYAERFASNVVKAPARLETFPESGQVVPEFDDKRIRELIYGSYRIIYLFRADVCYVVAVVHGSRDLLRHLKPGDWNVT